MADHAQTPKANPILGSQGTLDNLFDLVSQFTVQLRELAPVKGLGVGGRMGWDPAGERKTDPLKYLRKLDACREEGRIPGVSATLRLRRQGLGSEMLPQADC